jgi:hypothetical protein
MSSIIGRILTGVCGGLLMAVFNHFNAALTGWASGASIAVTFLLFFGLAVAVERWGAKKPESPAKSVGSGNETQGSQTIEIASAAIPAEVDTIGSGNKAVDNQHIKIG